MIVRISGEGQYRLRDDAIDRINVLDDALEAADNPDADKIQETQDQIDDLLDDELFDLIRDIFSEEASNDWLHRIQKPNSDMDSRGPSGDFTKNSYRKVS